MSESAERVAHNAIREVAERIFQEHGIIIEAVKLDWKDLDAVDEVAMQLVSINLATKVVG